LACGCSTGWWPISTRAETGVAFALIHSPFVGPSCWRPAATALTEAGASAVAVDYGGVSGPDWYGAAADRIGAALAPQPAILVLHSGAGGLAGAITRRVRPAALIYTDAILPHPGASWADGAPALAAHLRGLAVDGLLPPWNTWFAADPAARLIADESIRQAFTAQLPRVPLAFLDAPAPPGDAAGIPTAYLQLSAGYADEAAAAKRRGWTVRAEPMHHLAMVTEPAKLAAILLEMAMSLGVR
jgi:hypothetical protein